MNRPKYRPMLLAFWTLISVFALSGGVSFAQEPNDLYVPEPKSADGAVEYALPVSNPNMTIEPVGPSRSSNFGMYLKVGAGIAALLIVISVARSGRKGLGWLLISYVVVFVTVGFYFVFTALPFGRRRATAAR